MCSVSHVIHRVVVVVVNIIAMMRKLVATVPKMVGQVDMLVIDTRVDDSYHDALSTIAQLPNLIGAHLKHIWRNLTCRGGWFDGVVTQAVMLLVETDYGNVIA